MFFVLKIEFSLEKRDEKIGRGMEREVKTRKGGRTKMCTGEGWLTFRDGV